MGLTSLSPVPPFNNTFVPAPLHSYPDGVGQTDGCHSTPSGGVPPRDISPLRDTHIHIHIHIITWDHIGQVPSPAPPPLRPVLCALCCALCRQFQLCTVERLPGLDLLHGVFQTSEGLSMAFAVMVFFFFFPIKETLFNSKKHRRKSGPLMGWKGGLGCE